MENPRVLSIQDVSCFGQCSLTVALPILSAMGVETAILPTAILSTHTAGFTGFTFHDLSGDIPAIMEHWKKEGIVFDAIYTGYLGSKEDVELVLSIASSSLNRGPLIVDPAFGDQGKLYGGFDLDYVQAMKTLMSKADYCLPNLTEAAFALGKEMNLSPSKAEAETLLKELHGLGMKSVVLKGLGFEPLKTGVMVYENGSVSSFTHEYVPQDFHGTGDVFASVFVGGLLRGLSSGQASRLAAEFVLSCVKNTLANEKPHPYGVRFEPLLGDLISNLKDLL